MDKKGYIITSLLLILNFVMGIININRGSYYYGAISFTAVGFISGMITASILDNY